MSFRELGKEARAWGLATALALSGGCAMEESPSKDTSGRDVTADRAADANSDGRADGFDSAADEGIDLQETQSDGSTDEAPEQQHPRGPWHLSGFDCVTGDDGANGDWDDEVGSEQWVKAWFKQPPTGDCYIGKVNSGGIWGVDKDGTFPVKVVRTECPLNVEQNSPADCYHHNGDEDDDGGWVVIAPRD